MRESIQDHSTYSFPVAEMFATITLFIAGLLSTSPRLPKHPSSFLFVHLIREPSFGQSYHELELRALLQGLFTLTLCRMHTCVSRLRPSPKSNHKVYDLH